MHLKRWLTALFALPIVIYLIGFSPAYGFYIFISLIIFLALREFYHIVEDIPFILQLSGYFLSFFLILLILNGSGYLLPLMIFSCISLPMIISILVGYSPSKALIENMAKGLFGVIYISLPLSMLMIIYKHPYGKSWIFFLLCLVFLNDTGAFYFGRYLGKYKLHKEISPNKTWEGAIGGLICSIIGSFMFLKIFRLRPICFETFLLIFFLAIIGQIGDLAESLIKRSYNVKDSGTILPGHGGILDRIDSFLFTIPVLYGYMMLR